MTSAAQEHALPLVEEEVCVFNGIDGETGKYLVPPLPLHRLAELARKEPRYRFRRPARCQPAPGQISPEEKAPAAAVAAPGDLGQAGWGVIFAEQDPAIREALAPLLDRRREQANERRDGLYQELTVCPKESKTSFLARQGISPGPADPAKLPYYLLLVGDPEAIPFEFQYQLDVQYAVGRIHFDQVEDYARYARTVVAAESGRVSRPSTAVFFGPRNPGDAATERSSDHLVAALSTRMGDLFPAWSVQAALGEHATKARLKACLEGEDRPALLFTAGHGLCFRAGSSRQRDLQGSLVCQDWPGPEHDLEENHYFAAGDVTDQARLSGMITFHFSCYGAGTPNRDDFPDPVTGYRPIAPRAFLSRLAQRLLSHPGGGALAVIAHVDRAWGWSFGGPEDTQHTLRPVFESTLQRLLSGYPVGFATEYFNSCYAELASDLDDELRRPSTRRNRDRRKRRIAQLWTNRNDARSYAVLGDPAVRLAVARQEAAQ